MKRGGFVRSGAAWVKSFLRGLAAAEEPLGYGREAPRLPYPRAKRKRAPGTARRPAMTTIVAPVGSSQRQETT
jgi:hypothetical protein